MQLACSDPQPGLFPSHWLGWLPNPTSPACFTHMMWTKIHRNLLVNFILGSSKQWMISKHFSLRPEEHLQKQLTQMLSSLAGFAAIPAADRHPESKHYYQLLFHQIRFVNHNGYKSHWASTLCCLTPGINSGQTHEEHARLAVGSISECRLFSFLDVCMDLNFTL